MPLFQQPANGSYLEPILLSESNRRGNVGHTWAWKSRDPSGHPSCVVPRPSDESNDTESSHRALKEILSRCMSITWVSWERHV